MPESSSSVRLPEPSQKAAAVRSMFDRIAARYDLMNRLMTLGLDRGWRRLAVERLEIRPGDRVLDLACGTGDLAREAARRAPLVVGVDFSPGMLAVARARGTRCFLVRADVLALPFADSSFDGAVSGFTLRNFVDIGKALRECRRVLRPGGKIVLLEVDRPHNALLRLGHRAYLDWFVPLLGALLSERQAYSYLAASTAYLPDEERLFDLLRQAAFEEPIKESLFAGAAQLIIAARR